ncbi:MAG: GNAT family N-acetyltransferase [Candidatus Aminicenantes bacterium]|nr:GNAT family N-acetyltransferase [Candidatus Aminicenantes bacterium]
MIKCVSCGSFPGTAVSGPVEKQEMLTVVEREASVYPYDQYRHYPTIENNRWENYLLKRLKTLLSNEEWLFFFDDREGGPYLLSCRISKWDEEHFGFKMAFINVLFTGHSAAVQEVLGGLLAQITAFLRSIGVKFISCRLNGDNPPAIHAFEAQGFRYYENIIWVVMDCKNLPSSSEIHRSGTDGTVDNPADLQVRLMKETDLREVLQIAGKSSYRRGHYNCDVRFDRDKVHSMHVKWIQTAWQNKKPISVLEKDNKIYGYFVFNLDEDLSAALGYRYGRMRNLGLDPGARRKGLGSRLFLGTAALMKDMGALYIDSGYSVKNHISAKLHAKHLFFPVYEEVTLHYWL